MHVYVLIFKSLVTTRDEQKVYVAFSQNGRQSRRESNKAKRTGTTTSLRQSRARGISRILRFLDTASKRSVAICRGDLSVTSHLAGMMAWVEHGRVHRPDAANLLTRITS